jgi:hypothetical protein
MLLAAIRVWINAHTNIATRRVPCNHFEHYGTPSGDLRQLVVMMHATFATTVTMLCS